MCHSGRSRGICTRCHSERSRGICIFLLFALLTACDGPPVEWNDNRAYAAQSQMPMLTASGDTTTDTRSARVDTGALPAPACPGSVRIAAGSQSLIAVWWSPRADSSAQLLSARSANGGAAWSAIAAVDTLDKSVSGCHRAPPSVAFDGVSGYVHVSYSLVAPEGPGIFFSHSMDRGATFHSPVAIIYGERIGNTSVAASGDNVAVAFEDPNSTNARVGLALSRTMGHIFENRLMPVSGDNGTATRPLVALEGHNIAIAWREGAAGHDSVLRVRTGTLH